MRNKYYLGLDMGTNSIGWAVTDEEYNLIRKKGKDCWGVREFDSADSAVERRVNRVSRRRNQRDKVRRGFIRAYFADEIAKVDPCFLARLDNSKYYIEDKEEEVQYKSAIFNDAGFGDADYYNKYPTIFHLRKELLESAEPHDVRLVYLAISNMFKHRGHFLNESLNSSENGSSAQELYDSFVTLTTSLEEDDACAFFPQIEAAKIIDILSDKDISRSAKADKVLELLNIDRKQKRKSEFVRCLCGLKVDGKKLFNDLESEEKIELCFGDYSYEDKIPDLISAIGDENYQIVELMKQLYDMGLLAGIRKDFNYLSEARVAEYEKHKADLALLKKVIKKYCPDSYDELFRSKSTGSYSAYVNSNNTNRIDRRGMGGNSNRNYDALCKKVKSIISGIEDENVKYILDEIAKENFLPKQLTDKNGVIPNQLHKMELKKILSNAEKYLPFLTEIDGSGLTVSQRIVELFSFQIPYYIGPTSEKSSLDGGNGWVVRKNPGTVMPWNMEDKIDVARTSEQFIMRMVRDCSYIRGEKVLPKSSLEYETYCVLNEINNIRVNGDKITVELKQNIFEELFKKSKNGKPTRKALEKYLIAKGILRSSEQLTGIDTSINNSLKSYSVFFNLFGEKIERDDYKKMIERIIFLGTVYGDSKKMFKNSLEQEYSNVLNADEIKRIIGYRFKDWGRLSKEFLEMNGCNKNTGEIMPLIRAMWDTNNNLMELLNSNEYTYAEELAEKRNTVLTDFSEFKYEDLDDYYFSSPVKRMVWQTIIVVREIEEVMGNEPERVFIEMTRSEQEKGDLGRKASRKKMFLDLYKNIKDELQDWNTLIEDADNTGKLRSKKMYLYITQMGRDMYTGEPINLDKLFDDNVYDIDHIYPRSFVKDDNISNNLVLVDKRINNRKQNYYPIDAEIVSKPKVQELWNTLHKLGLMNDEKYARLTCRSSFSDEQLAGFIARQIVETSQATKGIAGIIRGLCNNTTVVYSKAGNVSDFRHKYDLLKSRLANEFHHAHDAYLNIVVGNVYYVKFTQNPMNFIKNDYSKNMEKNHYHLGKMFEYNVERNGEKGWIASNKDTSGTIAVVKRTLSRNTPTVTRMNYEGHGTLFNLTLYGKSVAKCKNYVAIKRSDDRMVDVEKYGGYTSVKPAYFIFIEYGIGKKRKRAFDVIPLIDSSRIKSKEDLKKYCEEELGYENVRIICEKIKKDSLVKLDGFLLYIVGLDSRKNVEFHNAVNLYISPAENNYIHDIESSVENRINPRIDVVKNVELYDSITRKFCEGIWTNHPKCIANVLQTGRDKFVNMSIEEQVMLLHKILQITAIGGNTAIGLKEIDGPASDAGRIRISGNMTDRKELLIINQSAAGFFSNSINLLAL